MASNIMADDSSYLSAHSHSHGRKVHRIPRDSSLNQGVNLSATAVINDEISAHLKSRKDEDDITGGSSLVPVKNPQGQPNGNAASGHAVSADVSGTEPGSTSHKGHREDTGNDNRPFVSVQELRDARRRKIMAKGADRLAYITGDRKMAEVGEGLRREGDEGGEEGGGGIVNEGGAEGFSNSFASTSSPPNPPTAATSADFCPLSGTFTTGISTSPRKQLRGASSPQLPRRSPNPKPAPIQASPLTTEVSQIAAAVSGELDTWQRLVASRIPGKDSPFSSFVDQLSRGRLGSTSANQGAAAGVGGFADVAAADFPVWQVNTSARQVAGSGAMKLLPAVIQSWDATSAYRTLFTVLYAFLVVLSANSVSGSFPGSFLQPLLLMWPVGLLLLTHMTTVAAGVLLRQRGKVPRSTSGPGPGSEPGTGSGVGGGGVGGGGEGEEMREKMEKLVGMLEGWLGWGMLGWKVMGGLSADVALFLVLVCCGFSVLNWMTPGSIRR